MSRKAAKIDANQPECIETFVSHDCAVKSTAGMGDGFPDLVVWDGKRHHLVEVKQKGGKLTPKQVQFREIWPGPIHIVRSPIEVIALVQEWRKEAKA